MTTIDSATLSPAIGVLDTASANALTPEAVLAYCTSRLNTIEDVIKSRFAEQQRRNDALKSAGALLDILNWNKNGQAGGANGDKDYTEGHKTQGAALANLYRQTSDGQVRAEIAEKFKTVTGRDLPGDIDARTTPYKAEEIGLEKSNIQPFTAQEWAQKVNSVKTLQDGFSKDNEISMIQLQSMISQRQLAIQLTTQMMAAMAEASKGIVANIRG